MTDRQAELDALRDVYDPCCEERGISIVDMGLIEQVEVEDGNVRIGLVLTTGWCPFVANMSNRIPERLLRLDGVEDVQVEVLWDPVWTNERLSPEAREKLAMPLQELEPYRRRRIAAATANQEA